MDGMARLISEIAGGGGAFEGGSGYGKRPPLPEAQIMTLREICERYQRPNPFKVGDLVHPRADSRLKGRGMPHIVIEVFGEPIRALSDEANSNAFGLNLTMRVCCFVGEGYSTYAVEHAQFEHYTGEGV